MKLLFNNVASQFAGKGVFVNNAHAKAWTICSLQVWLFCTSTSTAALAPAEQEAMQNCGQGLVRAREVGHRQPAGFTVTLERYTETVQYQVYRHTFLRSSSTPRKLDAAHRKCRTSTQVFYSTTGIKAGLQVQCQCARGISSDALC